jgi:hypothetical protein
MVHAEWFETDEIVPKCFRKLCPIHAGRVHGLGRHVEQDEFGTFVPLYVQALDLTETGTIACTEFCVVDSDISIDHLDPKFAIYGSLQILLTFVLRLGDIPG